MKKCGDKYRRPRLCRLCECPVVDGGVRLHEKKLDKLSKWWKAHWDTDLQQKSIAICHFCVWDLRFADENSEEKEPFNQNWLPNYKNKRQAYHHYKFYKNEMLKPCSVKIVPIVVAELKDDKVDDLSRHRCIYCPRTYATFENLVGHANCNHPQEVIRCRKLRCRTFFHTLEEKIKHLKREHKPNKKKPDIKCMFCEEVYTQRTSLNAHLNSKHVGQFFRCKLKKLCSEIFKTEEERDHHFKEKHNFGNYFCCFCDRYFKHPGYQREHVQKYHKGALKCNAVQNCPNYFKTEEDRQEHIQEKHPGDKKRLECFYCSQMFSGRSNLQAHINKRHKDVFIKCNFKNCGIFFKSEEQKQKHLEETHKEHQFFCIYCDKICFGQSGIHWHFANQHSKEEVIRCRYEMCPTYFKTEEDKLKHVREVHEVTDPKLCCVYCQKYFTSVKSTKLHVKRFHPDVVIRCDHIKCATFFKTLEDREKHTKEVHQAEKIRKPVQCLYCDQVFGCVATFKGHIKQKHADIAIKCPFPNCGQYFKSQEDLDNHFTLIPKHKERIQKSAEGSKFFCPLCPKAYIHIGDLQKHKKLVHEGKIKGRCPHCQKVLLQKIGGHIITNFCRVCNQKFLCFGLMKKHKLTCKMVHKCPVCAKVFKRNYVLQEHCRNVHTVHFNRWRGLEFKSLGFKCDKCCIYFRTKHQVPQHFKNRHTFSTSTCDLCQKQFQNKFYVREHIKSKHVKIKD